MVCSDDSSLQHLLCHRQCRFNCRPVTTRTCKPTTRAPQPLTPIDRRWSLQPNGDLWDFVWNAILKRGAINQHIRNAKGHATLQDVAEGRATTHDKIGNKLSDEQADEGVNSIDGQGLTRRAKWIQDRHDNYTNLIKRIHKVLVAVHIEEKKTKEA